MINTATPIALGERLFSRGNSSRSWPAELWTSSSPIPRTPAASPRRARSPRWPRRTTSRVALHCPLGPIALAACLQIDAVCHNAFIQEQSLGIHYNAGNDLLDYVTDRSVFAYREGFVAIPTGAGLGIEINEAYVIERSQQGHRWRNPIWRHADGSIAEW